MAKGVAQTCEPNKGSNSRQKKDEHSETGIYRKVCEVRADLRFLPLVEEQQKTLEKKPKKKMVKMVRVT